MHGLLRSPGTVWLCPPPCLGEEPGSEWEGYMGSRVGTGPQTWFTVTAEPPWHAHTCHCASCTAALGHRRGCLPLREPQETGSREMQTRGDGAGSGAPCLLQGCRVWLFGDHSFLPVSLVLGALVHICLPAIDNAALNQLHRHGSPYPPLFYGHRQGAAADGLSVPSEGGGSPLLVNLISLVRDQVTVITRASASWHSWAPKIVDSVLCCLPWE